ncbi:MAG: NAD(P)/FAD-dependent oxidoreductase [Pseudomonadota bacterium]
MSLDVLPARGLSPRDRPRTLPDAHERLRVLGERVRSDLDILRYPSDDWVMPRAHSSGAHVYDVVIVGAGQGGLATAFALQREKVSNVLIIDQSPKGHEGPWVTYSKMWTLRSPKHLTGPDLGIPSLTPRAYFEARYGESAFQALGKWPRTIWQDYLNWYREVLNLPVENRTALKTIEPDPYGLKLTLADCDTGGLRTVYCRKLVLATGLEGMGGWYVPPMMKALPKERWSMCTDSVGSDVFEGRSIAILGAGATAWDRAADLLEHGARAVTIYMRRPEILKANPFRYMEKAGYLRHYAEMDDGRKWRWMRSIFRFGQPPTQDGVDRCAAFDNFTLHAGTSWAETHVTDEGVCVTGTDGSRCTFDHLFVGCGFSVDPANRPELAPFAHQIARWRDKFALPKEDKDNPLADYPYLDDTLAFTERTPGEAPFLKNIRCFNYGATMSNAHSGASLSGMKYGIGPLIAGITRDFWNDDELAHFRIIDTWAEVDTDPAALSGQIVRRNGD